MEQTILVINPNSLEAMTQEIDAAVAPLRITGGPKIECVTLAEGPPGINSQQDGDSTIAPMLKLMRSRERDCAAFVIACYGDPGIDSMREASRRPVLGIAESGVLTALTMGQRFGVIALSAKSVSRQLRKIGSFGVTERLARILPLEMSAADTMDEGKTFDRMVACGQALRDVHGANVVIMGCAGMAGYRKPLQDKLGIPVVEPTQAAVGMAIARVRLNWEGAA
jgi:Asp/Glu/hydantoin racemase